MPHFFERVRHFFSELQRRNVYQVAVTYVIVGVFVIEAADLTFVRLGLPAWTVTLVIALVGLGFPLALVMAWALEVTPEGVRVEETPAAELEGSEEIPPSASTTQNLWIGGSVLVLLLLGAWWIWGGVGGTGAASEVETGTPETRERSIAVLPFEVTGSGADEWRDGMVTMLSMNLDGAAGLRAIPDRTVFAAWQRRDSTKASATASVSTHDALAVARGVGAEYAIVGSAVQVGEVLQLGAEVHRTRSAERLGQVRAEGAPENVKALIDELARKSLRVLLERSEEKMPSVDLASITTESLRALKSYLAGERHFRDGDYEAAIQDFEAAIRRDSTFALAYARLNPARYWTGSDRARRAMRLAYRHSGKLPRRKRRIVRARYQMYNQRRPVPAADSLRRLSEDYPDDPSVWFYLGEVLFHDPIPRGLPEAENAFQRALDLDPGFAQYHHHLVDLAFSLHRDSALVAERIANHPGGDFNQTYRLAQKLVFGPAKETEDVRALVDRRPTSVPGEVLDYTLRHPVDGVLREKVLRRLTENASADPFYSRGYAVWLVANHIARGQIEEAYAELQRQSLGNFPSSCLSALAGRIQGSVPDSVADSYLNVARTEESASVGQLFCTGLFLIDQGGSQEGQAVIRRMRAAGSTQNLSAERAQRLIDELHGYGAWKEGDLKRAEKLWSGSIAQGRWESFWTWNRYNQWAAIWRGDLYRELGKLKEAEGWYLAAWQMPVAHERLGQLYETMGKPEKAAAAYERFIAAWTNADPALQDRVEAARNRLQALPEEALTSSSTPSGQGLASILSSNRVALVVPHF